MDDTVLLARYLQHLHEYTVYYVRQGVPDGQVLDLVGARAEACGFKRTLITPAVLSALKSEPTAHAAAHLLQLARASRQQAATAAAAAPAATAARPGAVPAHLAAAHLTSQQITTLRMAHLAAQGHPNTTAAAPVPKKQRTAAGSAAAAAGSAGGSAQMVEVEQEDEEGQAVVSRQARRALHGAGRNRNRHGSLQLPKSTSPCALHSTQPCGCRLARMRTRMVTHTQSTAPCRSGPFTLRSWAILVRKQVLFAACCLEE
jgi:hypothetical protein